MTIEFNGYSSPYGAPPIKPEFTSNVYTPDGGCQLGSPGQPMEWGPNGHASGEIGKVRLNGRYFVSFKFEDAELRNWLKSYVTAKPEAALQLLAEMQAEATISLAQKVKRDVLDEIERS